MRTRRRTEARTLDPRIGGSGSDDLTPGRASLQGVGPGHGTRHRSVGVSLRRLLNDDREHCQPTFSRPKCHQRGQGARNRSSSASYAQSDAHLPQHPVAPCLMLCARDMTSGHELPDYGTDRPVMFPFTDVATRQCGDAAGVLAVASGPSAEPWILRRVTVIVQEQALGTDPKDRGQIPKKESALKG